MFNKIYVALLAVSAILMVFLVFYAWSWLGSIGAPAAVVDGYRYYAGHSVIVLFLSTTLLLLLGNVILWTSRNAWAMWTTFVFFAVFALAKFFWLDMAFAQFSKTNAITESGFSVGPVVAVGLIALAALIVFLDQFVVVRLVAKMYPAHEEVPVTEPAADPDTAADQ